jgi:hypothetical protein
MANDIFLTYRDRILSYVGDRDPMDVLEATAARLKALVAGKSPEQLARTPSPGKWSVAQILAHLADAEIVGAWRFRSVLASNTVPLQAFDQNNWASAFKYAECDPEASIRLFEVNRAATLALLRRVDPALHENYGMHAERGKESVTHLMRLYAGHDLNHLAQIETLTR